MSTCTKEFREIKLKQNPQLELWKERPIGKVLVHFLNLCFCYNKIFSFISVNKTKVYYGLLKEPDIQLPVVEEEDDGDGAEGEGKPKKKKPKKDPLLNKKAKSDPNAPPASRMPLPDL